MPCPLRPLLHMPRPTFAMHHAQRVHLPARIPMKLHLQPIDIR